jgi:hypothetical protein
MEMLLVAYGQYVAAIHKQFRGAVSFFALLMIRLRRT